MARCTSLCGLSVLTLTLCLLIPATAPAGPLDEAKGRAHLKAVAAGDLEALMRDYADDAYMDWIGGPLDGRYRGKDAIREVWHKFIALNKGQPRPARFDKLEAHANPKGATIVSSAEYGGATPVKVWHALVYRDGELGTEIWQIAPALQIAP